MIARTIGLTKFFGSKLVFENVDFEIKSGDRVALIGENGSGKSTLFRILAGKETPDTGNIIFAHQTTVGYLEQEPHTKGDETVFDIAMSALPEINVLLKRMQGLEAKMVDPAVYNDAEGLQRVLGEYGQLQEKFEQLDGYAYEAKVRSVLSGIGFNDEQLSQKAKSLSGGEKKILGLVQLLIREPDLILLDEPDNHLDLQAKEWLEQYILNHKGAVAIISHDRYFLDRFINHIFELEDCRIYEYHCNYSGFREEKLRRLEKEAMLYEMQKRQLKELERSARQLAYWASLNNKFAGRSRNRKRLLEEKKERLANTIRPIVERPKIQLDFREEEGSRRVLEIENLSMVYGKRRLFAPFNLTIQYGERVGLLGPNGSGKTTLFRLIMGKETPTIGKIKIGPGVKVGYYSQEHESLPIDRTPLEYVRTVKPTLEENAIGILISKLQFEYEECLTPIRNLSGGQKSRLQLAGLGLAGINFLLLDEPTNNLDIPSMIVLEDALFDYEGTLLIISHDRYFLDQIVDRIIFIQNEQISEFPGTFSDFYKKTTGKVDIGFSSILR